MRPPIKFGLIYGVTSIVLTLLKYVIKRELIFDTTMGLVTGFGLAILFVILAIRADRGEESGYSLGDGLKAGFITYAIGTLIATIFTYVLTNIIDPQLIQDGMAYTLKVTESMLNGTADLMGLDEAQKAEMLAEASKAAEVNPFTPAKLMIGWVMNLIGGLILALITAAIMKRD